MGKVRVKTRIHSHINILYLLCLERHKNEIRWRNRERGRKIEWEKERGGGD